ncbi:MAG: HIT family protein [Patescibacteria group bacterium]|nr:HIT family protein [Patescibacteria group bacterium]MDE1944487.1 HIT family protein [Patescibacteria group bacterium]MDE1944740.1 HIT family protein [Patescibacteria group bacterium]MDE2057284.1 HIT family protein [Patescibacteria group bacterium]
MDTCLFCKIVRGEIPAHTVYEDDATLAFLDIHPVNPGHTLVVPKRHSFNLLDIDPADWAAVAESTRHVSKLVHDVLAADGINLQMNNREHAGQDVDHPHVHIIPRYRGDGLPHWRGKSYQPGEAEEIIAKLRAAHA